MTKEITINKYLPWALLYFFFNSLFLPLGLLYTSVLAPLFLIWIIQNKATFWLLIFFLVTLSFACIHVLNGVNLVYYTKSYVLLLTAVIFAIVVYLAIKKTTTLPSIFKQILIINFLLTIVAVIALKTELRGLFWYEEPISPGVSGIPRLKMFTYEASYYSTLLAPLVLYFYLKLLLLRVKNKLLIFIMVTVPLVLSFSFGVLLGIGLSIFFLFCSDIKLFFVKRKFPKYLLLSMVLLLLGLIILIKLYPGNPVFMRISNVFEGKDTSFKGRTTDSFFLAWQIADMKSILFGCGLGQIKVLGLDLLTGFYVHSFTTDSVKIPNAGAETLAMYGILGLTARVAIEIYLFFKTRVFDNYYRLSLFLFIFIYQFTGSFLNNVAEYVIWILAFAGPFSEFDKKNIQSNKQA